MSIGFYCTPCAVEIGQKWRAAVAPLFREMRESVEAAMAAEGDES
jgi:hypothetical protein